MQSYDDRGDTAYVRALAHTLASPRGARHKVALILGARQTGKTTLLHQCVPPGPGVFTINLQDTRERQRYEREPGLLVRELAAAPQVTQVVIDEIQKVPALLDDVQHVYDTSRGRIAIYLTGSSARQLKRRAANLLAGRAHVHVLSPVLQAEQRACELLPVAMAPGARFPQRSLTEYLLYGNLPGLYHEAPASWQATLHAYASLYVEQEIRQENLVHDMGAFLRFVRLAALEAGQYVNYTRMARDIGVAVNTLRNFYQVLEDTHVGLRLMPFSRRRKRIIEAPRMLIFDVGVRHALAELPCNETLLTLDAGRIFEQWVLIELYYRCQYHGPGYRLSTWRTATGAEVDAVIETPRECIPVEVKWTDAPTPQDARHLETFLAQHGDCSRRGYVICRARRRQQLTPRVQALPWDEF